MTAEERLAPSRSNRTGDLAGLTRSEPVHHRPGTRMLAANESEDQAVGNTFASDGSVLPNLGRLAPLKNWPSVAAVIDRKALQGSHFNPAATTFDETKWNAYLSNYGTIPFFQGTTKTTRETQISSLSLATAVDLIKDFALAIAPEPTVAGIIESVKKIATVALTNKEKEQKDSYQNQGLICIKSSILSMGMLYTTVSMKYVEGKGYQQLTQKINMYMFEGQLDFAKCQRSSEQILKWDRLDVEEWADGTSSAHEVPNGSPAWNN